MSTNAPAVNAIGRADDGQPLEFLQVAFSGHSRAADLGDRAAASAGLAAAFSVLAEAGVSEARLLCGSQAGGDRLAADAWRNAGLGDVHLVEPFLEAARAASPATSRLTRLPGDVSRRNGRSPHLAQARWLIAGADVLVVLWNGRPPRGPGGTGDVMRLALERGTPVLWVRPGTPCTLKLIRPERLDPDVGLLELLRQLADGGEPLVTEANPTILRTALRDVGLNAASDVPPAPGESADRTPSPKPARTYAVFRRLMGGKSEAVGQNVPPTDLAAQSSFAELSITRAAAASAARRLASVHRSQQLTLLVLAILAAVTGSASSVAPAWKPALVALELLFALLALMTWLGSERGVRHRRWTEARKLAEDLRLERAA